ncbi:ABC transporter substrate-binding protein [Actinocorallia longicatena]|uniref:Sulfonate ABC transporter substrate-binding protein n=1 Tax=Actinocorallia longicatena TaxID=111803 RepID=A0ABP6Q8B9_9ACTN
MTTRVGFFPQNNSLWVLRHRGILERSLPDVAWVNLRDLESGERVDPRLGLPSLHGDHLFDGGYDFIGTGATPPITAQGKGHDIVYVAISEPRHENGRLVTLRGNGITSPGDLRGRRVGLGHGSWQTTLVLLALEKAGLTWKDIEPVDVYDDAARRFLDGEFDVWVGSYPYLREVEAEAELHDLVATETLFTHRSLWFTGREWAAAHPGELRAIVEALQEADRWTEAHPREAAELFPGQTAEAWEHALVTRPWGLHPVSAEFVAEQQRAADLYFASGLIDREIRVADAVVPEINDIVQQSRN